MTYFHNMNTEKKLQRPRKGKMIGGVCAAIGNSLNIDPTILRIVWLLTILLAGTGLLAYIICWLLIPLES